MDVSALNDVDSATIPGKVVKAAAETTGSEGLKIKLPTGTVKLDSTALAAVNSGRDLTVSVETAANSKLTNVQKKALGEQADTAIVVDVNVLVSGVKDTGFGGGTLTISIPYTPKAGEDASKLTIWYIRDDDTIENKGGHYDAASKCFVFETEHLSQYVLVATVNPFSDVAASAYYYDAVLWAVEKGVTEGTGAATFSPDDTCTRGQIVTFLWRYLVK